jgi:hypothetical protein
MTSPRTVAFLILALATAPGLGAQVKPAVLAPPPGGPVVVRASFHLQGIDDIQEEAETFQFTGVLTLTWRDKRQAFDPARTGVDEKIYQGEYQFNELSPSWYPQVVLANEAGLYEKGGTILRVKPDGTSTLIETIDAIAKTTLNLRRYPFDSQQLNAVFEVLGFDKDTVVFETGPASGSAAGQGIQIPQWDFTGLRLSTGQREAPYVGKKGVSSTLLLSLDVHRRPFFMLRLVVIPLVLIVILSWSVFWMDRSSLGDRINVSFIGLLTAVAYQVVVSEILPHIAYVTLMNAILSFSFIIMCAAVVINLVVGELDKRGNAQAGDLVDYRCRFIFPIVYFGLILVAVVVTCFVL